MASYFQAYFQASSMPKRLLQYALSRLEILDTDALGLENLDIAWGKNSIFEFKDVGLRLKKLEALLQLPPSFEFVQARVLLLRVTIPVDIYSSPIVVDVDGVACQLRVKENHTPTNHERRRKRTSVRGQARANTPSKRKGSYSVNDEDVEPALPTAVDLAESFLQTEPEEEKAELEAAILSETQEIGTSSVLSEDGDTEIPMGTGTALSLPAFMARFLKGIVDRLQVRIQGITLNMDVEIPNETSKSPQTPASDPVTIQLKVDSIDIEGVTHDLEIMSSAQKGSSKVPYKIGKRLICLNQIRGALITEANLFSSLARSSALSSPSATQSDVFDERKSSKSRLSRRGSEQMPQDGASSSGGTSTASSSRLSSTYLSRKANDLRPLYSSFVHSDSGRFDDAPEDESLSGSMNADLDSDVGDSVFQNSAYLDQVTESQYYDDRENEAIRSPSHSFTMDRRRSLDFKSPLSTPRASVHLPSPHDKDISSETDPSDERISQSMVQSTILPTRQHSRFSAGRVSQSQPSLPAGIASSNISPHREDLTINTPHVSENDSESGDEYENSTPVGEEDLAQSQLFSHEDAESMYMSALSHGSSSARIPGGWAHSSSGSEGTRSIPGSPISPVMQNEPLDNLKHARDISPSQRSGELGSLDKSLTSPSIPPIGRVPSPQPTPAPQVPSVSQVSSNASERSNTSSDEYIRMRKHLFIVDQVAIYLPETSSEATIESADAPQSSAMFSSTFDGGDATASTSVNVPGAFSKQLPPTRAPQSSRAVPRVAEKKPEITVDSDQSTEIRSGQVLAHFDISVGRLIWKLVQRLKDAMKLESQTSGSSKSDPNPTELNLKFSADNISLKFLERLEGALGSSSAMSETIPWTEPPGSDILLRTNLKGLSIDTIKSQLTSKTVVRLRKLVLGYAQENIVSFDAGLQMRSSVRDLKVSDGLDISINILQAAGSTRIDMNTLPLHVAIDLQRLDETFSWFGGLSSVLNLGSSIASNATVTTTSPSKSKPRSVRFETPNIIDGRSSGVQNKIDVRIGGFVLDLIGQECSVGMETSALKIAYRDALVKVAIDKIRLSGPHLRRSNDDPAINVDIGGTRIDYLPSPTDVDLDTLLSLITPSKAKYDQDDDILLDTLLRQRKQGAVLRVAIDDFKADIAKLNELSYLPELGEEISRLATVTKYLPDDERPGLLSLIKVKNLDAHVDVGRSLGAVQLAARGIEVAQITLPALVALSINSFSIHRNGKEELLGTATDPELREPRARAPAIMARMIGDEMEPIVKLKLWNLKTEYRVSTLIALLDLAESATSQDISASLTASVATLTGLTRPSEIQSAPGENPRGDVLMNPQSKPMTIDVVLRDCILGLNPMGLPSKVLLVLTEAHMSAVLPKDNKASATGDMGKASLLVIDDVANITFGGGVVRPRRQSFDGGSNQVADLCAMGYVSVSYISSAKAMVQVLTDEEGEKSIDIELRDDLFVLESCADSTQTLIAVLNGLSPPTPPSKEIKYRTKVIPVHDLLASLSGDAFGRAEGDYNFDDDFGLPASDEIPGGEDSEDFDFDSHYYQKSDEQYNEAILEDVEGSVASAQLNIQDTHDGILLDSFVAQENTEDDDELVFEEDHFGTGSVLEGTAHRWNSTKNTYDKSNTYKIRKSPLKVCVRDVHIIWNLFDGYDWQHTRDTISKAVQDVESKAIERRARNERRPTFEQDVEDEETVIGDFLFNSIYIGIPGNRDPRELAAAINQELNDNATETESIATTTLSSSPSRQGGARRPKSKRLRLNRSKHHKITFELKGVCVDLVAFPPGSGETQSSIDIRVRDFEIFDHVPTSTWRKFATYMQDAGERETGTSMIHIEMLNVKPIPELAASEIVLKATVLPLRLHVDQDALDFITRFFEFKADSAPLHTSPGDVPFLQRVEVNSVQVKLDFKPKRVDYAGLRSGHTTEFMNFLILDEADMVLRHTIIYGISGFDKLGKTLNDIWMPDIKRNQLPGILAGLAPVRSIVNVGGGLRHLVVVPMREYKKDGRIVRSISKGAAAFARTTGTELVKLGAKVAIGVQTVLQGAEGFLSQPMESSNTGLEDDDTDEESKQISLYANQPVGVLQGLRGGYAGLQRDLVLARDAIIAVPGEVMEGGNAAGVLRAVRRHAPTVILRPAIGVAKAGGQILMGATNSLDPVNIQRADAKYKKH